MKKIVDFFIARKRELALFILVVMAAALSGANLGFLILLILFFGGLGVIGKSSPERLLHILEVVVVLVSVGSYAVAKFPRSNSKVPYARAALDQNFSSAMPDRTQVEATDLWDTSKDSQREKFLAEYRQTLKAGETKKAYELLEKFQSKWDMKEVAASMKAMKDSITRARRAGSDNSANAKAQTEKVVVLEKGVHTFTLRAGEKSPKIIVNGLYCAVSDNADQFQLFYPELNKTIPAWTSGSWPRNNTFFIESLKDQTVTITVT